MSHRLAFIGFGGVGQGLADILIKQEDTLSQQYGFETKVVAITDMMKGSVYQPDGLDLKKAVEVVRSTGSLDDYPEEPGLIRDLDSMETIKKTNADTIIEVTFTDVKTGQPAIDHCKAAFKSKKNVVTTNKGPVALAYEELNELAEQNGVYFGFEGTVMSGTPALRMPLTTLAGNEIYEICGILNGTSNYILTKMEEGLPFEDALKEAQAKGYAEADPTNDIEGYDVRYKTVILSQHVLNVPVAIEDVACKGISDITLEDIEEAKNNGKRWKLLARLKNDGGKVTATVGPEKLPLDDPLASITGATNAVTYYCNLAGPITLSGAGAGITETGYALLIDLIHFQGKKEAVTS
ncbi:homoserine dehydrogenase [Pseudalkalibacillus caeni]|uniref:Homoserine dehydrogenase n=1 Tax=Exobacillus caeni TaxID=2574798 RepID=A0A5R9F6N2_9BACL|nr:homoserine dehydrogenase [Pseudalkalibacillus caeni]TLS36154.1 homoserine dehydrogenase [Pseudalkalibacillus caeni]